MNYRSDNQILHNIATHSKKKIKNLHGGFFLLREITNILSDH